MVVNLNKPIPILSMQSSSEPAEQKPNASSTPFFLVEALRNLLRFWELVKKEPKRLSVKSSTDILGLISYDEKLFQVTLREDILSAWTKEKFEFQEILLESESTSVCPDTS